ncbi:hypothetical protein OB2597_15170 [Pseudooceanicola batsensis HTCC2597]|uniref:Lipoprotein n=1 Tax=Pseudooceanicola batsensis (strain ATCC BAA-863 / DSM 15984 / KCTC 12145 / HTCC2597) TaxID=252305 RepID=A3TYR6_PSEBH|nr:hypothetical protein [Pseudooceanicola batsensis]EAQ02734.1 hypothetical protein OB2597_15170 [Pseudooceanicola batsensis HTCC2597]
MARSTVYIGLLGLAALAGCAVDNGSLERARMAFGAANPRPDAFQVCGSHGCDKRIPLALTPAEWREVRAPFARPPRTAPEERRALAEALRRIEVMVGRKTGYDTDTAFSTLAASGLSQDCIDEMVNTAVYLALLDDAGHLRFHRQGQRVTLGMMTRRFWTHTVATIVQRDTGQEFIIDTWAVKVGETPYIMDRSDWAANAPFRHDF